MSLHYSLIVLSYFCRIGALSMTWLQVPRVIYWEKLQYTWNNNTIYVQLNKKNPTTFLSLASSISTSLTSETPPTHSSLSNQTVDPTTALIALMHQPLQQNYAMMAQLHSRPSTPPAQQPSPSYQYRSQRPPFPIWDVTPPMNPLLFAHIATYKAEAF